jgi:hypothetical protein
MKRLFYRVLFELYRTFNTIRYVAWRVFGLDKEIAFEILDSDKTYLWLKSKAGKDNPIFKGKTPICK